MECNDSNRSYRSNRSNSSNKTNRAVVMCCLIISLLSGYSIYYAGIHNIYTIIITYYRNNMYIRYSLNICYVILVIKIIITTHSLDG